ncbi:MAG: hypothetical protein ABIW79_06785 [Gemmatimonas sp.]
MTLDEALAALAEAVGSDAASIKEAARKLRDTVPALGQELLNAGAAKKKGEVQADITRLQGELDAAKALADETQREFDTFKDKTPDVAAIEATWKAKVKAAQDEAKAKLDEKDGVIVAKSRGALRTLLVNRLVDEHHVNRRWADKVVAAENETRLVAKPDGTSQVLQLGRDDEYDGESVEAKIALLAADLAKSVDAEYVTTNVQGGGGQRGALPGGSSRSERSLVEEKQQSVPRMF